MFASLFKFWTFVDVGKARPENVVEWIVYRKNFSLPMLCISNLLILFLETVFVVLYRKIQMPANLPALINLRHLGVENRYRFRCWITYNDSTYFYKKHSISVKLLVWYFEFDFLISLAIYQNVVYRILSIMRNC